MGKHVYLIVVTHTVFASGTIGAGGFAGIMNWIAALPLDVLKTRLQVKPFFSSSSNWGLIKSHSLKLYIIDLCLNPSFLLPSTIQVAPEGKYKHGIRSVFFELIKTDGFGALYKVSYWMA